MNLHVVITKARGPNAPAALQGMTEGWNQQIDKLGEWLQNRNRDITKAEGFSLQASQFEL